MTVTYNVHAVVSYLPVHGHLLLVTLRVCRGRHFSQHLETLSLLALALERGREGLLITE